LTFESFGPHGDASETATWTGAELAALANGSIIELRYRPAQQRCKSFSVTLQETMNSSYEGTSPIALRLVMGVDGKAAKQARANALKGAS
jgi:hypothetical protein